MKLKYKTDLINIDIYRYQKNKNDKKMNFYDKKEI